VHWQTCDMSPASIVPLEQFAATHDAVAAQLGLARILAARLAKDQSLAIRPSLFAEAAGAVGVVLAAARDLCRALPVTWPVRRLVTVFLAAHIERHGAAQTSLMQPRRPVTKQLGREPALRRWQSGSTCHRPSANFRESLARAKTPPADRMPTGGGSMLPRTRGKRPPDVMLTVDGLGTLSHAASTATVGAAETGRASSASFLSRAVTPESSLRSVKGTPEPLVSRRQPTFLSEVRALLSAADAPYADPGLVTEMGFGSTSPGGRPLWPRTFECQAETTQSSSAVWTSAQSTTQVLSCARVEILTDRRTQGPASLGAERLAPVSLTSSAAPTTGELDLAKMNWAQGTSKVMPFNTRAARALDALEPGKANAAQAGAPNSRPKANAAKACGEIGPQQVIQPIGKDGSTDIARTLEVSELAVDNHPKGSQPPSMTENFAQPVICPGSDAPESRAQIIGAQGIRVAFGERRNPVQRVGWRERPRYFHRILTTLGNNCYSKANSDISCKTR
jgi:hypothetical protein